MMTTIDQWMTTSRNRLAEGQPITAQDLDALLAREEHPGGADFLDLLQILLAELQKGAPDIENGLFWKIWPWYVKLVCPLVILLIFSQAI